MSKKTNPPTLNLAQDVAFVLNLEEDERYISLAVGDAVTVTLRDQWTRRLARITQVKKSKTYKGTVIIDLELI